MSDSTRIQAETPRLAEQKLLERIWSELDRSKQFALIAEGVSLDPIILSLREFSALRASKEHAERERDEARQKHVVEGNLRIRAQDDRAQAKADRIAAEARLTTARERITALEIALETYGVHAATCPVLQGSYFNCECGLERVLAAAAGEGEKASHER